MTPTNFPQSNFTLNPAQEDEGTVFPVPACKVNLQGGIFDGAQAFVIAWKPLPEEIDDIKNGSPVFLCCFGAVPPHSIHTVFPFTLE